MNEGFWIVLVYLIISAVGGLMSRQAKKSSEASRTERRRRLAEAGPDRASGQTVGGSPQPQQVSRGFPQTPEQVAAEIRRVMGLEQREAAVELIEPAQQPPAVLESYVEPSHGGHLRDDLAARRLQPLAGPGHRPVGTGIDQRHWDTSQLGTLARQSRVLPSAAVRQFSGSAYVDITNIAQALVTMEVLGPPKALRDDW